MKNHPTPVLSVENDKLILWYEDEKFTITTSEQFVAIFGQFKTKALICSSGIDDNYDKNTTLGKLIRDILGD